MAYNELVKNLDHIRSYMRDFYVFGFKSRDDYNGKSLRSYDDEKRRLESWLGEYMEFRRTTEGKYAFISIDSRHIRHNPLFKAWKTKSFTSGDITLHFILFDILASSDTPLSLTDIIEKADTDYLCHFEGSLLLDESTVRKKLKEYAEEGLLTISKEGKKSVYALNTENNIVTTKEVLDFYSEIAPCGVIGSFLLDKEQQSTDCFAFKHHYITSAIDSDILCRLFDIISQNAYAEITSIRNKRKISKAICVVPLQIYISVQNGRQYLLAWNPERHQISPYRLDYILDVKKLDVCENISEYRDKLERSKAHMWGVLCRNKEHETQHIEFTVHAEDNEDFIYKRLMREKRCGEIEIIDKNTFRFYADVYDINEMIPWIRTFICRIIDIQMEDKILEEKFKNDIRRMYSIYDIGDDDNAVQRTLQ